MIAVDLELYDALIGVYRQAQYCHPAEAGRDELPYGSPILQAIARYKDAPMRPHSNAKLACTLPYRVLGLKLKKGSLLSSPIWNLGTHCDRS